MSLHIVLGYKGRNRTDPKVIYVGNDGVSAVQAAAETYAGDFVSAERFVHPMGIPVRLYERPAATAKKSKKDESTK